MIDVDDVATDADLEDLVGGAAKLQGLIPEEWLAEGESEGGTKTAKRALERALRTVLASLANRRPPIRAEDLVDVTQLNTSVCFGALEILHRSGAQYETSPNKELADHYLTKFKSELAALQPETQRGASAGSMSIRISRG